MIYKPLSVQFEITESCTHKCGHCYNYYSDNRSSASTSRKVTNKIAEQEFFDITLTGGEPLSARPQLYDAIEIFKRENMDVRINSNLHLLKDYDAKRFADFNVDSILSSILGSNEKTHDSLTGVRGSFEKLGKSLKYLSKNNLRIAMNMVVNKNNVSEVYETGKFLFENFGINYFAATPMTISPGKDLTDITLSREEYVLTLDNLLKLGEDLEIKTDSLNPAIPCMFSENNQERYKKFFENRACGAGKRTLTFSIDGEVRPCSQEGRDYGNIMNDSLENILTKMNDWRDGKNIPQECSSCEYLKLCGGGCRVSAEASSGKLNGLEPYFTHPVKKNISRKENKLINFESLKAQRGNLRMREEENGLTTIYLTPRINGILTPTELKVFRRFLFGRSYNNILSEVKNEIFLKEVCTKLSDRKLLVDNSA